MPRLVVLILAWSLVVAPLVGVIPAVGAAQPERRDRELVRAADAALPVPAAERRSVKDWYIVRLRDDAPDPGQLAKQVGAGQGRLVSHVYRRGFKGFAVKLPVAAVRALRRNPYVISVEPDQIYQLATQEVPTGVRRIEAAPAAKNAAAYIDGTDERVDVGVAVIDTGIDADHPDLNYAGGFDCMGADSPRTDPYGHGTHVAGTIGALDNGVGVVGVAPGVRLWSIKVLDGTGRGVGRSVLCGIETVTANAGVIDVANMSLRALYPSAIDDNNCGHTNADEAHQLICASVAAGVTYVVAAGNDCVDASRVAPAAYDEVITVSAMADTDGQPAGAGSNGGAGNCSYDNVVNQDDTFASFSNYGADIDLAAPGVDIVSTYPVDKGEYATLDGTSMAAPHVAGAAALILARRPSFSPPQVRAALVADRERVTIPGDPDGIDEGILNVNDDDPWVVTVDDQPPTAAVTSPRAGVKLTKGKTITVKATSSDGPAGSGVAKVEFRVCKGTTCSWEAAKKIRTDPREPYRVRWRVPATGRYTFLVRATDRDGNVSDPMRAMADEGQRRTRLRWRRPNRLRQTENPSATPASRPDRSEGEPPKDEARAGASGTGDIAGKEQSSDPAAA